ncbi:Transcription factor [Penicillium argentinense]|uniref:Transcription factor n=1 Tax=Penicillium argentinense TaxID=1131581 RepID=A0A9W9KFS8_9EURO|nr:Transcription factor [Penicillium argentinense]KAJ5103532.1 Transcription factor [Penicillium argentinense]
MYERQRVWRACQACRRKKVKCDGEHPCQSCTRNKAECVFEPYSNMRLVDPQYVVKLEKRLAQMEKNLKDQHSNPETTRETLQSAFPSHHHGDLGSQHDSEPVQQPNLASDEGAVSDPPNYARAVSVDAGVQTPASPLGLRAHNPETDRQFQLGTSDIRIHSNQQENTQDAASNTAPFATDVTRLNTALITVLVDLFYQSIYSIFPIIHARNFRPQYDRWLCDHQENYTGQRIDDDDNEFSFLLYALLSVAASLIPKDHAIFEQDGCQIYQLVNLDDLIYSHATSLSSGRPYQRNPTAAINTVAAQGLLSLYLTERGRVNEAWVIAGHAIRLYQGLNVEDDGDEAPHRTDSFSTCSNIWWCLYILDRSLSTALLKPLAIDDAESEIETTGEQEHHIPTTEAKTDPWFSVIADFHITMGRIYRSVRWIRKSQPSQNAKLRETLRSYVKKHDAELENYYTKQVLPRIEATDRQEPLALQTIAVSSYYIGVVLLYRTFIERLNIAEPEAFLRCAEAASNCIKVTPQVMATVPASHFVIQQSRAIYASAKVLLHCMRLARNPTFTKRAWSDVESGLNMLCDIKIQWPEIKKYQTLTEEDMHLTQRDLRKYELFYKTFDGYGQVTRVHQQEHNDLSRCNLVEMLLNEELNDDRRENEVSDRQQKRRKLSSPSALSLQASENRTSHLLSMDLETDGYPVLDPIMNTDDFLLGDLTSQPSTLGDPSLDFFSDAMLMTSIDNLFSQSED